jgi:CrcB protein
VAVGGAAGSVARYGVATIVQRHARTGFPTATFVVNVAGSFALGLLLAMLTAATPVAVGARLLLATGFCGGFTTFSAFAYETVVLARDGRSRTAAVYVVTTVLSTVVSAGLGFLAAR